VRRDAAFANTGLTFIGMGVSGGEEDARHGPSIMVGGQESSYKRVEKVLTAIAAKYKKDVCCARVGPGGAGHFVKTMHNGIEYADMQMIAEIYGLMRDGLGMKAMDMAKVFANWKKGKLNSYLIEITAKVLGTMDAKTKRPLVDVIVDRAGQKGTGNWSVIEAQHLSVPATTIEAAVAAHVLSSMKDERERAEKLYKLPCRRLSPKSRITFIKKLESALYAGRIAAYAQGFAITEPASAKKGWNPPLGTIASIWREGCIIRSQFLDLITASFRKNSGNLLMSKDFSKMMRDNHAA
jgi:6-phosphogluconate dehydrogenase